VAGFLRVHAEEEVNGMPSVGFRPPASRPFFKKLLAVRALPTLNEPRCHVIGKMAGVAFVIKRELFDSPVPSVEFCSS
jgi:hypothetical protein